MKTKSARCAAAALVAAVLSAKAMAASIGSGDVSFTADLVAADSVTKAAVASGHVHAVSGVMSLRGDYMERDAEGTMRFGETTRATTCTNAPGHTHWGVSGAVEFKPGDHVLLRDGWLYFTTHLSNYWKEGIENYAGAHVMGYCLATGAFRDLGIVKPRYSIYSAIGVDPERRKLYVFLVPFLDELYESDGCHLFSIDIDSGEKQDLGLVVPGRKGAAFWFFVDNRGDVWFSLWKKHYDYDNDPGNLYVYRVGKGCIETFTDVLPKGRLIDGTPVTDETLLGQRCWTWLSPLPGREKCYFTMGCLGGGDERLWLFDPSKDIASGEAFEEVARVGSTYFESAVGGDRFYFIQYEDLQDARTLFSEDEREVDPDGPDYVDRKLHLRSISLREGDDHNVITDHGPVTDQDGRAARMIMSMAADGQGRVYTYGSWHVKSFKEATLQYLLFEYPNGDLYRLVKRGEFFAVIDTRAE